MQCERCGCEDFPWKTPSQKGAMDPLAFAPVVEKFSLTRTVIGQFCTGCVREWDRSFLGSDLDIRWQAAQFRLKAAAEAVGHGITPTPGIGALVEIQQEIQAEIVEQVWEFIRAYGNEPGCWRDHGAKPWEGRDMMEPPAPGIHPDKLDG